MEEIDEEKKIKLEESGGRSYKAGQQKPCQSFWRLLNATL